MSLWVLVHLPRDNEAAREAAGQVPYRNPNEGSAPLPPTDGGYDTLAGTPGMRSLRPDRR
ncbi:MAG: hypothetical protein ACRDSL_26490 [Pseudonocardiaceae bacterium]